ncbi:MAG: discoidin domain-containing protein [Candidatus Sericytochromatia bacterium]|nr:discoidin domain-containing protein [Candidatus Tanganyikabacteria bacterium]
MPALIMALAAAALALAAALSRMTRQRRMRDDVRAHYRLVLDEGEQLESELADRLQEAEVVAHLPPLPGGRPWAAGDEVLGMAQKVAEGLEQLSIVRFAMSESRWQEARQRLDLLLGAFHEAATGLRILEERIAGLDRVWGLPATSAILLQRARGRRKPGQSEEAPADVEEAVASAEDALAAHVGMEAFVRAEANRKLASALADFDGWHVARDRRARIVDLVRTETPVLVERIEDAGVRRHPEAASRVANIRKDLQAATESLDAGRPDHAERRGRRARDRGQRLLKDLQAGILPAPGDQRIDRRTIAIQALVPAFIVGLLVSAITQRVGHLVPGLNRAADPAEVARGAPARVTSVLREGMGADKLTDGRPETAWMAGQALLDGPVAVVGLRVAAPLASISVLPCSVPSGRCTWEVDVSTDSRTWYTAGSASGQGARSPANAAWGTVTLDATTSWRLIRIRPVDWGKSGVGIFEVRAWRRPTEQR